MKISYEELKRRKSIVIWGVGRTFDSYYKYLDPTLCIEAFADTYPCKLSMNYRDGIPCISKEKLTSNHAVLIAIENLDSIEEVSREMDEKGIDYCHIFEAAKAYLPELDKKELANYRESKVSYSKSKIVKFINCHVPYQNCNLKCNYCYVRQVRDFRNHEMMLHSPDFIRRALSKERLGGIAFINFCAGGETLLCEELLPIVSELVKEGHFIQIVTNGTVTKSLKKLVESDIDLNHIFLKFSFHYLELKRLELLERFSDNVMYMWNAGCSITLELVADDKQIPYIQEIKEFSLNKFGALPHCTVPRNDTVETIDVLSHNTLEDLKEIWGQFNSEMFNIKMRIVNQKRHENCMAGVWSFELNLETGAIHKCVGNPYLDNIYEDLNRPIHMEKVGQNCCLPYCYNGHAYLPLGLIKEILAPTYLEIRDRETLDGKHWVSGTLKEIFSQRLYDTNAENE